MEEIDWSKAPEGATHFYAKTEEWYKLDDSGKAWAWSGFWVAATMFSYREQLCVNRPRPSTPWSGQGLPPVGTVCEGGRARTGAFNECVVIAHRNGMAIAVFTDQEELQWVSEFRPIRTHEQIAKDEREAAIKELKREMIPAYDAFAEPLLDVITRLGYHKP